MARVITRGVRALVRSGPGTNFPIVGSRSNGDNLDIIERRNGWARIGTGQWINEDLLTDSLGGEADSDVIRHPSRPRDPYWKLLVNFGTNSDRLSRDHEDWLRRIAANRARMGQWVWIRGLTSHLGGQNANQHLSERRANAVRDFLLRLDGVPSDKISGTTGIGSRWARGSATDDSGRWRGVEVIITNHVIPLPGGDPLPSTISTRFYIKYCGGGAGGPLELNLFIIRNPSDYWIEYSYVGAGGGESIIPISYGDPLPSGHGWKEFTATSPVDVRHFVGIATIEQEAIQIGSLGGSNLKLTIPDVALPIDVSTGTGISVGKTRTVGRFTHHNLVQKHNTDWRRY